MRKDNKVMSVIPVFTYDEVVLTTQKECIQHIDVWFHPQYDLTPGFVV